MFKNYIFLVLIASLTINVNCIVNDFLKIKSIGDFQGNVALVTGGSEGIGYQTVLKFAQQGAKVVFCARDSNPSWFTGAAAEKTINSDPLVLAAGGEVTFFRADIRNITQVRNFVQFAHEKYGKIDHFVNNAGIGGWVKNIWELQDDMFLSEQDPIYNNLYGLFNLLRTEIQYVIKHGDINGNYSIVNVASYNGLRACPSCSLYGASKHGIVGVTKSVAVELNSNNSIPHIRVNALCPGLIDTSLTRNQVKTMDDPNVQMWEGRYISQTDPLWLKYKQQFISGLGSAKRLGEPSEMANVILFLSDNNRATYVNGQIISADNTAIDK